MPKPDKISLDPATMSETDVYKIVARCIVRRPIGFVSTISAGGIPNAARQQRAERYPGQQAAPDSA
jgi:hypothetical protein